ncbi:MAG: ATP-binding protein [Deltaproteobacteria bacterium]|nr:ATP-binding protein [Deltaproteobacteria bacterium]
MATQNTPPRPPALEENLPKRAHPAAILSGYKVLYREAHIFFEDLFEATQLKRRKGSINSSPKPISWSSMIYFCARKFRNPAKRGTDDLLDIILNRYSSRKSTLLTSNRPIEDRGNLLRDNAASSAILDRLLHRGHVIYSGTTPPLRLSSIASFIGGTSLTSREKAIASKRRHPDYRKSKGKTRMKKEKVWIFTPQD